MSRGVPSDRIRTRAVGKDQQLDAKKVEALQSQDPEKPEKWETRQTRTTWLAYNRRADVILEPEGEASEVAYPNDVADARDPVGTARTQAQSRHDRLGGTGGHGAS